MRRYLSPSINCSQAILARRMRKLQTMTIHKILILVSNLFLLPLTGTKIYSSKKCLRTIFFRRCIVAFYYFCSASRCLRHLNGRERRGTPRSAPQTSRLSFSSTRSFVKVAPIRLRLRLLRTRKCPAFSTFGRQAYKFLNVKKRNY